MVASITTYFKESNKLLKNFHQLENGLKRYHGEQNRGYHMKEHKKLSQKQASKVTLHFVWGQLSRKQTVVGVSLNWYVDLSLIVRVKRNRFQRRYYGGSLLSQGPQK